MNLKDRLDHAWAAGLIDGEGCIRVDKTRPNKNKQQINPSYSLKIRVAMADEKAIRKLFKIFKTGFVAPCNTLQTKKNNWSLQFEWVCQSKQCYSVLKKILPFSITKKEEILAGFEFLNIPLTYRKKEGTPAWILNLREDCYKKLKALKPKNNLRVVVSNGIQA